MNYAYISMLSTDDYFDGILALYQGLKNVQSKYPLVVCITPNISQENIQKLQKLDIELISIPSFNYTDKLIQEQKQCGKEYLSNVASKFYLFGLSQFDKIVSLDCDLLILRNIDDLFNYPHGSAAPVQMGGGISGGVVVLEPSEQFRDDLMHLSVKYNCNEEQSLNRYFSKWRMTPEQHLPQKYNFNIAFSMYAREPVVIHFIGNTKPFIKKSSMITSFGINAKYRDTFLEYVQQAKMENNL